MNNRFYSLNDYLKSTYGKKIYKIALDGGFTCPTRDGSLDTRGCIFCSGMGSGDFSVSCLDYPDVQTQLEQGISLFKAKQTPEHFIAYFQSFTGTYAPKDYCRHLYMKALSHPKVCGISIGTRPDCLGPEIIEVLKECKKAFPDKFIWIELGLQTIHESTATYIRRHYPLATATDSIQKLHQIDIPVILHIILGLPHETEEMVLETIQYVNKMKVFGVKLQLLHVLSNTDLAREYASHTFEVLSKDAYLSLVIKCLEHLDPNIVIHRVTGDGPKDLTIAPLWSLNKRDVLNSLHQKMKEANTWQGRYYK